MEVSRTAVGVTDDLHPLQNNRFNSCYRRSAVVVLNRLKEAIGSYYQHHICFDVKIAKLAIDGSRPHEEPGDKFQVNSPKRPYIDLP